MRDRTDSSGKFKRHKYYGNGNVNAKCHKYGLGLTNKVGRNTWKCLKVALKIENKNQGVPFQLHYFLFDLKSKKLSLMQENSISNISSFWQGREEYFFMAWMALWLYVSRMSQNRIGNQKTTARVFASISYEILFADSKIKRSFFELCAEKFDINMFPYITLKPTPLNATPTSFI